MKDFRTRLKPKAQIEDWWVSKALNGKTVLMGRITGHPFQTEFNHPYQITSQIIKLDEAAGIAETANTIYILGQRAALQ